MMRFFPFILLSAAASCSQYPLHTRAGKDEWLTPAGSHALAGAWYDPEFDTARPNNTLWKYLEAKNVYRGQQITLRPESPQHIWLLMQGAAGDTVNVLLKGRYRKGYFITRVKKDVTMPAGPLLWGITGRRLLAGLTKEKRLVLLYAGGSAAFLLAMPVYGTNAEMSTEFIRAQ
jgi:hypothetical protein